MFLYNLVYELHKDQDVKMIKTTHFMKRTSQRGITKAMVNYALEHGEIDGNKLIVNRKLILRHREEVLRELAVMAKLLDE